MHNLFACYSAVTDPNYYTVFLQITDCYDAAGEHSITWHVHWFINISLQTVDCWRV